MTSAPGRSRAAARASRSPVSSPRRTRRCSGAVTTSALSWLRAAVRAWMALRRSSKSRRSSSRRPPPRGRLSPFAAQQPSRGQRRVDHVALAAAALLATRPLALPDARRLHARENGRVRPRSCRAFDSERGHAELLRPGEQTRDTRLASSRPRGCRAGRRTDRERPRHERPCACRRRLPPSTPSPSLLAVDVVDRPGQGCVGQRTQASIRSPASRAKRRRETGPNKARPNPPASLWVIPPPPRTLSRASDNHGHPATLHSFVTGEEPTRLGVSDWCQRSSLRGAWCRSVHVPASPASPASPHRITGNVRRAR